MPSLQRTVLACLAIALALAVPRQMHATSAEGHNLSALPPQETGFLNRKIDLKGVTYHFQVYLPEDWRRDDGKKWPIILFLHGRGERGSEGMWQTQVGLPEELRDHPERWPFIVVMPQVPENAHWTDPAMMNLAMGALDSEAAEFHADPDRTYLAGLSLGGYGAWELARNNPHRWAAIVIAASGIFWSYQPQRWKESATLPAEYAAAIGSTPIWLFHGTEDAVVAPKQSQLMFDAFKAAGGRIRLWLYQSMPHDSWTRAFNEPELPQWLLAHRNDLNQQRPPALAERLLVPPHPLAVRLSDSMLDNLAGQYREPNGKSIVTVYRQGDTLFEKDQYGVVTELAPESSVLFFYPNGSNNIRLVFERDRESGVTALIYHDDRHEERWDRQAISSRR